ncbi:MAG: NAD(P)H-dependent glycerol-3-phosphate dehydrogenase [Gammaproteobacteria bacterium]
MKPNIKTIAVLGTGAWGTALAYLLANNGHTVNLWGVDALELEDLTTNHKNSRYFPDISLPQNIKIFADLEIALADADFVIAVVPSHVFSATLEKIQNSWPKEKTLKLAWGTKGLTEKQQLLHEVVEQKFGKIPMTVISGPSFAKEVIHGLPTAITVASNNEDFANTLASSLHSDAFRAYTSKDIVGVEIAGAVKNVLAIAVGMSDGMKFGANSRAALITRGLAEIKRLSSALGGKTETLMGLSGLGDLVLTCTDNESRNRRFGLSLGAGSTPDAAEKSIGQTVEGRTNAKEIYLLAKKHHIEMPISEQVYKILYENLSPREAVVSLLKRARKEE